jgi:NtrC-family two-component system response regulator AlgB
MRPCKTRARALGNPSNDGLLRAGTALAQHFSVPRRIPPQTNRRRHPQEFRMSATLERRSVQSGPVQIRPASLIATINGAWRPPALETGGVDIVDTPPQIRAPHTLESRPVPNAAFKPAGRILAIDDDARLLQNFTLALESDGYSVETADNLADGLRLAATRPFHVCLLDHNIGYDSGLEALPRLRELAPLMRVVMVTANAAIDDAVKAIALGASDYLVKPCSPEQLRISVARQVDTRRILDRLDTFEREAQIGAAELTSKNKAMQAAIEMALQVARTDANLLLLGESGTGKGVIAKAVHRASPRAAGALVTVNCPSLSAELMESELFGHSKGSFTGAVQNTVGRVTHADGGTIFLDEVGDFPLALQPKLLRFIQDKEYERVGDPVTRKADARIVAATNRDLETMVKAGQFRLDLLYRLNVITITLPPLRERPEDLEDMANGFVRRYASDYGLPARRLSPSALSQLRAYAWPGNVRELQNMMERAVILGRNEEIGPELLALSASARHDAQPGMAISLDELEHLHIERVLASSESLDAAARTLGIDASTLYRKRKLFGL